jgi:hypothetical protein
MQSERGAENEREIKKEREKRIRKKYKREREGFFLVNLMVLLLIQYTLTHTMQPQTIFMTKLSFQIAFFFVIFLIR